MTFQIIKDLDSTGREFMHYLWAMENGEREKCLAAKISLDALELEADNIIQKYIELKNFKPLIIKEIVI